MSPSTRAIHRVVVGRLGVDERALAAFRVALGTVVLLDLLLRLGDVRAFYTDAGVLPRGLLFETYSTIGRLSLHALSGGLAWQLALFGATAVAALALAAGYRTRLATVATLVLVGSLHARNPVVLTFGDSILRRLLVWSVLLPLGARWSVDATGSQGLSPDSGDSDGVASLATAGLVLQVLAIYGVNALIKARGDAWPDGVAVPLVFGMDAFTVGLGDLLAGHVELLTLSSYAWVSLLALSPLLVLSTGRVRAVVVGAFAAAHAGMALTLRLGVFPLVSVAALLPLCPPLVWDRVEHALDATPSAVGRIPHFVGSLPPDRDGAGSLVPDRLRGRPSRAVLQGTAAALVAFMLVWNAAGLGFLVLPAGVEDTVDPSERRWDMFAPNPLSTDGWYATVGETPGGERVDAYAGTAAVSTPPPDADATYPSQRWYVYLTELRADADALRERFGTYLCQRWDRRHDGALAAVNVTLVTEKVRLDGPDERAVERVERSDCGGQNSPSAVWFRRSAVAS